MATLSAAPQAWVVAADVTFSAEVPDHGHLRGTLTALGPRIEIRIQGPIRVDARRDARIVRELASALHHLGVTVVIYLDDRATVEVGRTTAAWWQRFLARSHHVRVMSPRGVAHLAMQRTGSGASRGVGLADLIPPLTLLPLAPTFGADHRPVTTTHDPRRGGNPRLVAVSAESVSGDGPEVVFPLRRDVTLIGSGQHCDIRLAGLEEVHAVVVHDERDEMVVRDRSRARTTRVNGAAPGDGAILRTGARITLGDAMLVYRRAEYADHGRPFGGRVGGELGHQRRQPDPRRGDGRSGAQSRLSFPLRLRGPR